MADRVPMASRPDTNGRGRTSGDDVPIAQLVREFAADGRRLVRDEIDLAKLELRRTARSAAMDGALAGAGAVLCVFGTACLVAALVIGGGVVVGSYWVSALIVGILLLVPGAVALVTGIRRARSTRIVPERTVESLRDDAAWVGNEVRSMRRDLSRS